MAGSSYPHVVFAGEEAALDKAAVQALAREALAADDPQIEDKPLQLVLTLGSFVVTIWFDDEADQVSERYVPYLPPTARRRRLLACTTMLDVSGSDDPDGTHAGSVTRLAEALADRPGVFVFDETRKRFVGLDYGDEALGVELQPEPAVEAQPEPEPTVQPQPRVEPEPIPAAGPEPVIAAAPTAAEPEPASTDEVPEPAQVRPPQTPAFEPVPGPEATAGPAIPVPPQVEPTPGQAAGPEPHEPQPTHEGPAPDLVELPDLTAPAEVPGDHTQPVTGPPPVPSADRAMEGLTTAPTEGAGPGRFAEGDLEDEAAQAAAGEDEGGRRPGAFRRMLERRRERKRNR